MRRAWCKFCLWLVTHWPGDGMPRPFKLWMFFLPWAGEEAYPDSPTGDPRNG